MVSEFARPTMQTFLGLFRFCMCPPFCAQSFVTGYVQHVNDAVFVISLNSGVKGKLNGVLKSVIKKLGFFVIKNVWQL